jgi:hypothetical protein
VSDGKGGSYVKEFTTYKDPGGLRRTTDGKFVTHAGLNVKPLAVSLFNKLIGKEEYDGEYPEAGKTLGTFSNRPEYKNLNVFQKIKYDHNRNKELKQAGIELQKQKELKEQIAKEEAAAAKQAATIEQIRQQYAAQGRDYGQGAASQATQDSYSGSDGSYSGQGEASDWGGGEKDGGYIDGTNRRKDFKNGGFSVLGSSSMTDAVMKRIEALMDEGLDFGSAYTQVKKEAPALAHGGRVKSNNSGSLTEFVKSKLMEDDSQGLPAVQGIAIGMPSDQDGIISISRR